MVNFEKWFDESGIHFEHKEFARMAWNSAIQQAYLLVSERYDELEPWIEPFEVIEILRA